MQKRCLTVLSLAILLACQSGCALAQAGDILESGERSVQLELPDGALVALGPRSGVLVESTSGEPAVSLLRGWLTLSSERAAALVYYGGMSHSELAAHLNVPLGTAKAWVRRGLDRLRETMQGAAPAHGN